MNTKGNHHAALVALFLGTSFACTARAEPELVMTPGMQIDATTSQGVMTIRHIDKFTREYSWNGHRKVFKHTPRTERWYGSLGMYRPVGDRSMHAVLEEGQQHFKSLEDATSWLSTRQQHHEYVWTADGLAVGWKEQKRPQDGFMALHVDVWQLYVAGAKARLPGAASNTQLLVRTSGKKK